jgi:hypothetical protein
VLSRREASRVESNEANGLPCCTLLAGCVLTKTIASYRNHKVGGENIRLPNNGCSRKYVHPSRVYPSRIGSSRVLLNQESWCCMFHFLQSTSSDGAWRLILWGEKLISKILLFYVSPDNLRCLLLCPTQHTNRTSSGRRWLNVPNRSFFMCIGCTQIFHLTPHNPPLHILLHTTNTLIFPLL